MMKAPYEIEIVPTNVLVSELKDGVAYAFDDGQYYSSYITISVKDGVFTLSHLFEDDNTTYRTSETLDASHCNATFTLVDLYNAEKTLGYVFEGKDFDMEEFKSELTTALLHDLYLHLYEGYMEGESDRSSLVVSDYTENMMYDKNGLKLTLVQE